MGIEKFEIPTGGAILGVVRPIEEYCESAVVEQRVRYSILHNDRTAQLPQPTAMRQTGRCHITVPRCGLSSKFFDYLLLYRSCASLDCLTLRAFRAADSSRPRRPQVRGMATSSVERSSAAMRPLVVQDAQDGECSPRSPSVRAYVASFELQQQHRPLCRTDGVGRHHQRYHERPQPPCKTTTAVMKALLFHLTTTEIASNYRTK